MERSTLDRFSFHGKFVLHMLPVRDAYALHACVDRSGCSFFTRAIDTRAARALSDTYRRVCEQDAHELDLPSTLNGPARMEASRRVQTGTLFRVEPCTCWHWCRQRNRSRHVHKHGVCTQTRKHTTWQWRRHTHADTDADTRCLLIFTS